MDVTTTKAEIKTWEREFRAQNGRNATIEDIRDQPSIAEKYKLYKKLTKEADAKAKQTSTNQTQLPEPPRTPPRTKSNRQAPPNATPAAILPKSRPVATASDAETHNPFSPTKKRGNAAGPSTSTGINPFLTPIQSRRTTTRMPSPDPFPPVPAPAPALAPATQQYPVVAKARKRLRGEPVSPSPQSRDKRRRLLSGNDPCSSQSQSASPLTEEGESFVDDSPVKAPAGGKAFKPLFEEVKPSVMMPLSQPAVLRGVHTALPNKTFSRAKTLPGGLFGRAKTVVKDMQGGLDTKNVEDLFGAGGLMEVDGDSRLNAKGKGQAKGKERPIDGDQKVKKKRALPGPTGLIPGKDDLFEVPPPVASSSSSSSNPARDSKAARKRTISEVAKYERTDDRVAFDRWNLLPPSPPPQQEGNGWYNGKGKGKGKLRDTGHRKRKKAKVSPGESEEEEEDSSSSENADVKMVAWRGRPQSPQAKDGDESALTFDPELHFHLHGRRVDARARSASPRLEKFEVDLPDEMRRVLALSPRDWEREREEEDLVKGLMKGRRKVGGEVWGPGEVGGEEGSDEGEARVLGEEDWEGEGAPWQVAEL